MLQPIRLRPAYKDYPHGGHGRLRDEYGKFDTPEEITAESWEPSCHKKGESIVVSGNHKGKTLSAYIAAMKEEGYDVVGTVGQKYDRFPLLVKFLDSDQDLTLQVHPTDEYAYRVEHEPGKTEMWYYVECEPDAITYYGFNRKTNREEYIQKVNDGTIIDMISAVPVKPGDAIMVNSGIIHAVGKGTLLAEIQQNSDTTYSMYNYGRPCEFPFQLEESADVMNYNPPETVILPKPEPEVFDGFKKYWVADCQYFTVYRLEVESSAKQATGADSFHHLLFLSGSGEVKWDGGSAPYNKGDSIFVPANFGEYEITGNGVCLLSIAK